MQKKILILSVLMLLVLGVIASPVAADCECLGTSIPVGCGGYPPKTFTWVPCGQNVTVCTYDLQALAQLVTACCQSTPTGDDAAFANCMITAGGWFCGTCP